jgi:hypothetical protein
VSYAPSLVPFDHLTVEAQQLPDVERRHCSVLGLRVPGATGERGGPLAGF